MNAMRCLALTLLLCSVAEARKPNLVFILADDLGYETVGCMGGESYKTPHLDRLAAQGLRLDRAYAMPLCTNSRIQLMTGKYNYRNWKAGWSDDLRKVLGYSKTGGFPKWLISNSKKKIVQQGNKLSYA